MVNTQPLFVLMLELFSFYRDRHHAHGYEYASMPLGTIRTVAHAYNISGTTLMDDVPLMNDVFNLCANQTGLHFVIVETSCESYVTATRFNYKVMCTKSILIEGNKDLLNVLSI